VRPGDALRVEWEKKGAGTRFSCALAVSGEIAVSGVLRIGEPAR
jgi:hypothetical protein